MLTRGEFFLFYLFTIIYFYFFLKKDFKNLVLSVILALIILSPYLYRNYSIFNELTLTKSFGYNLLKKIEIIKLKVFVALLRIFVKPPKRLMERGRIS